MENEKKDKKSKSSKGVIFPFVVGMGFWGASWFYWPNFEVFFIHEYLTDFKGVLNPMFIFILYLIAILVASYVVAKLLRRFSIWMGTLMPLAFYWGLCEWKNYESMHQYISAGGLLTLLFHLFSQRTW